MALVYCPRCNGGVSDRAEACPSCGEPLSSSQSSRIPMTEVGPPPSGEVHDRSRQRRRTPRLIAKVIVILAVGTLLGYGMTYDGRQAIDRAEALTFEQYASEFEQYKEDLVADVMPPVVSVVAALLACATIFGLYEAAGAGLGWLISRVVLRDGAEGNVSTHSEPA